MRSSVQLFKPISKEMAKTLIALEKPVYYSNNLLNKNPKKASFEEVYKQTFKYYQKHV